MRFVVLCVMALSLAACSNQSKGPTFDGKYFRAKAKKVADDRTVFAVDVKPVSASLDGAREAGRHAGVAYCIENYGTSNIVWSRGPDAEDGTLSVAGDTLSLQGTCTVL